MGEGGEGASSQHADARKSHSEAPYKQVCKNECLVRVNHNFLQGFFNAEDTYVVSFCKRLACVLAPKHKLFVSVITYNQLRVYV